MKIIGMMCVRDEADLLPEVYPHIRELVDEVYAYDDGSQDETWNFIKDSEYAIRRDDDKDRLNINRPNYHHLLEKIKENHNLEKEDIWIAITMGDRFFLNKPPKQLIEEAGNYHSVHGIQLDFLRHRRDPWTEKNDTFPNYNPSLRKICRWVRVDEWCVVMYKATNKISYLNAKYPWPRGIESAQYEYNFQGGKLSLDMPYLEHQGRRSPKAIMWRHKSGSRGIGRRYKHYDTSTFESTMDCMKRQFAPYRVFPWIDNNSLKPIIKWENEERFHDRVNQRWFFKGLESGWENADLPERKDLCG